jgi:hypothetical protein
LYKSKLDEIDTKQKKSIGKSILDFQNLKENETKLKVFRPLSNVCDFQKESWDFKRKNHTLGYGFINIENL